MKLPKDFWNFWMSDFLEILKGWYRIPIDRGHSVSVILSAWFLLWILVWIFSVDFSGPSCPIRRKTELGSKKSTQTFFVQSFSTTLWVMDVRADNRGRPHQKVRFPAAPVVGRNFLTPGHSGVRVRNVRGKSGPKSLCSCCFFFPE